MNRVTSELMLVHLYWLTVLGQQQSYTRAAERLQVSKAAVSQKIAELERVAGVQLVQRTTRNVRLTDAGMALADAARQPFEQLSAALTRTRERAGEPSGFLRVSAPVAFSRQRLAPLLFEFSRRYPRTHVELDLSDSLRTLAADGYDLAVRHTQSAPETHVAWRLAPTRALLVASPRYLRQYGTPTTPFELTQHACLHYPRDTTPTWSFVQADEATGSVDKQADIIAVPVSGPLSVNNSEILRDASIAGLGIALLPDFSAQPALLKGELTTLLDQYRSVGAFGEWLYALRPYTPHVPAAVRAFVSLLKDELGKPNLH